MATNKVVYGNTTLIDLTEDTVSPDKVLLGEVFHDRSGSQQAGTLNPYEVGDTAETAIADNDYFPFYDTSASGKRKSLWSNIKAVLKSYFGSIFSTQTLLKDTVGWTGKNLFPNLKSTETINGVTYTVNGDGSVTVNGTATARSEFVFFHSGMTNHSDYYSRFAGKTVILSGCPSGGALDKYFFGEWDNTNNENTNDYGEGAELTFPQVEPSVWNIKIRVENGQTVSNLIFYPMFSYEDGAYEPYHKSVEQTLRDTEVIEGKNLLDTSVSQEIYGITFTVNKDKSVTVNGTSTNNAVLVLRDWFLGSELFKEGVEYHLSDVNGYSDCYTYIPRKKGQSGVVNLVVETKTTEERKRFIYNSSEYDYYYIAIFVPSGKTINNVTLYPMLCTVEEWNKSHNYEPFYIPLKDSKFDRAEQRVLGAKNLLKVTNNTVTINNVTYTYNRDSKGNLISIVPTGMASSNSFRAIWNRTDDEPLKGLKKGVVYTLSGAKGLDPSIGYVYVNFYTGSTRIGGSGTNSGVDGSVNFTIPNEADYLDFGVGILNGKSAPSGFAFYPMVRLASDLDAPYAPYAMTNLELTESVTLNNLTNNSNFDWGSDISSLSNKGKAIYKIGKLYWITFWFRAEADIAGVVYIMKCPSNISVGNYIVAEESEGIRWGGKSTKDGVIYLSISQITNGKAYRCQLVGIEA